jgi:hypothetical protein
MIQLHKETVTRVPNAKEGRDSLSAEIFGMDGVPYEGQLFLLLLFVLL